MKREWVLIFCIFLGSCALWRSLGGGEDPQSSDLKKKEEVLPQPAGVGIGDVMDLFVKKEAPSLESLKDCDREFYDFSKTNRRDGPKLSIARKLVRIHRKRIHWCFYSKILEVENPLDESLDHLGQIALMIRNYVFLTPIAQAFLSEFGDPSYLSVATFRYQQLNEALYSRRLEIPPALTSVLVRYWGEQRKKLTDRPE